VDLELFRVAANWYVKRGLKLRIFFPFPLSPYFPDDTRLRFAVKHLKTEKQALLVTWQYG
jgi:hypothetical protein